MSKQKLIWKKRPESEDFAAALNFMMLLYSPAKSAGLIKSLRSAKTVERAPKDLLRASQLPLLPRDEPHVDADLKRIRKRKPLAPVLLIRGEMSKGITLTVADGYHRICASYYYDENAPIPCRLVSG
jgi:hypothetical protein